MLTRRKISRELSEICYRVETEIVGHPPKIARLWARANAKRHACTAEAILKYACDNGLAKLTILNASGLSCGHQDFSLMSFLSKTFNIDWIVFESPHNPYLKSPIFTKMLKEFSIRLELADFAREVNLFGKGIYDVVLFTEIAEHLDHVNFLRTLVAFRERLGERGIGIITTPNLAYVTNRIKLLFGDGDVHYFGDGTENLKRGLWGHIVYYDLKRLKRLLSDVGLEIQYSYTFNYLCINKTVFSVLSNFLSHGFFNGGQTLFVVVYKSTPVKIPYLI